VADGVGLSLAARWLGSRSVQRYPGIELAHDLMARLAGNSGKVYLLGSAPGVAAAAGVALERSLPGLQVGGAAAGYFSPAEEQTLADEIARTDSDMLLVGMGSPLQEQFIMRNRAALAVPIVIGVGGALEVFAGRKQRAPRWMRQLGLEWLHRALSDFSRVRRLAALWQFVLIVLAARRQRQRRAA
jgi:N-acetylglucosaminyldiphosphoundecaprenol N-acetyl-beta-D-mannosaminyltransferase